MNEPKLVFRRAGFICVKEKDGDRRHETCLNQATQNNHENSPQTLSWL
jgi:hypothetical protein